MDAPSKNSTQVNKNSTKATMESKTLSKRFISFQTPNL
jgi:hypothetical protein